jgi:hypothetical protein
VSVRAFVIPFYDGSGFGSIKATSYGSHGSGSGSGSATLCVSSTSTGINKPCLFLGTAVEAN